MAKRFFVATLLLLRNYIPTFYLCSGRKRELEFDVSVMVRLELIMASVPGSL